MPQLDWICFFYDNCAIIFILVLYMLTIPMTVSLFLCKLWVHIFTYIFRLSQINLK